MSVKQHQAKLSLISVHGKLIANLIFSNHTTAPLWLEKRRLGQDPSVFLNVFRIRAGDTSIKCLAPVAKLQAPTKADFLVLASGAEQAFKIDLTPYYSWLNGRHHYHIRYESSMIPPPGEGDDLHEFKSSEVGFDYAAS